MNKIVLLCFLHLAFRYDISHAMRQLGLCVSEIDQYLQHHNYNFEVCDLIEFNRMNVYEHEGETTVVLVSNDTQRRQNVVLYM